MTIEKKRDGEKRDERNDSVSDRRGVLVVSQQTM